MKTDKFSYLLAFLTVTLLVVVAFCYFIGGRCKKDSDCPGRAICLDNTCVGLIPGKTCTSSSDCLLGTVCNSAGKCVPLPIPCSNSNMCPPRQACDPKTGRCAPLSPGDCNKSSDCDGALCSGGKCAPW